MQGKVDYYAWSVNKYKLPVSNQEFETIITGSGKEYINYLNLCRLLGYNAFKTMLKIRNSNLKEGLFNVRIVNKKKSKLVYMLESRKVYQLLKQTKATGEYKEAKKVLKEALDDDSLQDYRQGVEY